MRALTQFERLQIMSYAAFNVNGNQKTFMFLCSDARESRTLMNFLKSQRITLKIRTDTSNQILIELEFEGSDFVLGLNTHEEEDQFFTSTKIKEAPFTFLTTGYKEGCVTYYSEDLIALDISLFN